MGIPNLQDQLRLVDRQAALASEHDRERWEELGLLLAELYSRLQQQQQVAVHRFGNRKQVKTRPVRSS